MMIRLRRVYQHETVLVNTNHIIDVQPYERGGSVVHLIEERSLIVVEDPSEIDSIIATDRLPR